ncbi:Eukaryotic translation initiation factor 3 subunit D [Bienertia sinuspersici]
MAATPEFEVGFVPFNPDGWGPLDTTATTTATTTASTIPTNVPFAPFSRSEKLGRIADWTRNLNNPMNRRNNNSANDSVFDFSGDDSFSSTLAADEDSSFRLVDGKPPPRPNEEVEARKREAEKERARRDRLYHNNHRIGGGAHQRREAAVFKSSVEIQPEWNMLEQIPFSTFSKLSFTVPDPEDLLFCGALDSYDRTYDRLTPKNDRRLERSIYGWDIVVQRVGNKLFFDKRDGSQLDLLSVHETSQEPLPESKEDINSAHSLSVEAAYINQNFSQQVLVRGGKKVSFDEPNPFANEGEEVASAGYRYRRWKLDNDMYLVARCELQSVLDINNQRQFLTLNALNEFDPKYSGVDWRQKLETQRGAVLATELKNNSNKVHPRDHFNHVILGVVGYKPRDFASQINLNLANMWGIVKSIVDLCMKLGEGKYVLVKDPSKPQVRIYEVPPDAFENDYVEEPLPEEEQTQPPTEEAAANGMVSEISVAATDVEDKEITAVP